MTQHDSTQQTPADDEDARPHACEPAQGEGSASQEAAPAFRITVRKLSAKVQPRGVLAE